MLVKLVLEQLQFLRKKDRILVRKYEGPVLIVVKVGRTPYKIDPPKQIKVHPKFHVNNLKPFHANLADASKSRGTRAAINIKPPSQHQGG